MASFYTSVDRWGNNILWRGYENGKRFSRKVPFKPTLYLHTRKPGGEYRSLVGNKELHPKTFDSMSEAKQFVEEYKGISNMGIYGNTNYVAQFIQENYPGEIKFDMSAINIVSFDIEVDISDGYADIDTADKEITSIAYKSSKSNTYHLLGRKDYDKYSTITDIVKAFDLWSFRYFNLAGGRARLSPATSEPWRRRKGPFALPALYLLISPHHLIVWGCWPRDI